MKAIMKPMTMSLGIVLALAIGTASAAASDVNIAPDVLYSVASPSVGQHASVPTTRRGCPNCGMECCY